MADILAALDHIKQDPLGPLSRRCVEDACRDAGHEWRDRQLDPATTIALFIQQIAHGNTACAEVCHLGGNSFTGSAYCQARARLPRGEERGRRHATLALDQAAGNR